MDKTSQFTKQYLKTDLPTINVGDIVKVYQKITVSADSKTGKKEGERIQIFEGLVLAMKHGKGVNGTITVRRVISGVGVEKTFPLHSPAVQKIEIVGRNKVRRAKLYYLRERAGKKAKLKRKSFVPETPEEKSDQVISD